MGVSLPAFIRSQLERLGQARAAELVELVELLHFLRFLLLAVAEGEMVSVAVEGQMEAALDQTVVLTALQVLEWCLLCLLQLLLTLELRASMLLVVAFTVAVVAEPETLQDLQDPPVDLAAVAAVETLPTEVAPEEVVLLEHFTF
jgi:hypothetical protein